MSENNLRANRQVCDVLIKQKSNHKPFMNVDFANSTGINLSGDSVHAMAKGRKRISFQNPMDNTMTLEFQCFPFKLLSLFADGKLKNKAVYTVTTSGALSDGKFAVTVPEGQEIVAGSIFAWPKGSFGDEDSALTATYADNAITVTLATGATGDLPEEVEVSYMVKRTSGVKRIDINDDMLAMDVEMEMKTLNKTEDGTYVPLLIKIYKATIQRNFEMSFASEGDPASITMTFDILDTTDGNVEFIELDD